MARAGVAMAAAVAEVGDVWKSLRALKSLEIRSASFAKVFESFRSAHQRRGNVRKLKALQLSTRRLHLFLAAKNLVIIIKGAFTIIASMHFQQ